MQFALQILLYAVGLPLQVLVVAALIRGPWRRFPLLFALSVVELVSTMVQVPGALQTALGLRTLGLPYWVTYWTGQVIDQVLVYAVVISLLYRACERLRSVTVARVVLILVASLLAAGTFLAHYSPSLTYGMWLTPWFRDLNFACALMDVMLWTSLLVARAKDRQLLMLSAGLGVDFAGSAIGESLRQMAIRSRSHPLSLAGGLVMVAASLFRFYTWWRALRLRQPEKGAPAGIQAAGEPDGSL